jgi:arylsulfatase A
LKLEENTIVMFTSDNGPQFGESPEFGGEGDNRLDRFNCGYKGSKMFVYEGGIRVPMIISWPNNLEEGIHIDEMVHFNDWLPTILSMAGLKIPIDLDLDGINIYPVIKGEKEKINKKRFWQWTYQEPNKNFNAAARDGDWKYIRPLHAYTLKKIQEDIYTTLDPWYTVALYAPEYFIKYGLIENTNPIKYSDKVPEPELYNIADDSLEANNLANKYPERVKKMSGELDKWFADVEADRKRING